MEQQSSGRYEYSERRLSYDSESFGSWSLNLDEIVLIGEYTNEHGPFSDDYFIVFIDRNSEGWHEASFYGVNREEVMTQIASDLQCDLPCSLANSTELKSRIIWPKKHIDQPLFVFAPKGWLKVQQTLHPEIDEIRSKS